MIKKLLYVNLMDVTMGSYMIKEIKDVILVVLYILINMLPDVNVHYYFLLN